MKLSFICPESYCEALHDMQDFYLLLPHVSQLDAEYSAFFKGTKKYKIMDNSAHELGSSLPFGQVIEEAIRLECDEIVLTDHKFDMKKTLQDSMAALDILSRSDGARGLKIQAVPQGSTYQEYMECYEELCRWSEVDVIGLAFRVVEKCFKSETNLPGVMPNRVYLTNLLDKMDPQKEHHLLGLGNVLELFFQKKYSWIRSNDTTKQVKYAMNDIAFTVEGCADKVDGLLDFDGGNDKEVFQQALQNILVTMQMVK